MSRNWLALATSAVLVAVAFLVSVEAVCLVAGAGIAFSIFMRA